MPIVQYKNHDGSSVVLHGNGIAFMNLNVLRGYDWEFALTNRPNGMGGVASGFARRPIKKTITVSIHAETIEAVHSYVNSIHAVTEPDIIASKAGKLYVGGQYVSCFITGSAAQEYVIQGHFARVDYTVTIVEPYWCTETTTIFNPADTTSDTTAKKFNLRFPYRFATGYSNSRLNNMHYSECPMIITIYGAVSNPSIVIGGNTYNVATQVASGSRLVIDQTRHTIEVITSTGARTSVFNLRNKAYDVFKPLPKGENSVQHTGNFKFAVTLVKQRSGLEWTV